MNIHFRGCFKIYGTSTERAHMISEGHAILVNCRVDDVLVRSV